MHARPELPPPWLLAPGPAAGRGGTEWGGGSLSAVLPGSPWSEALGLASHAEGKRTGEPGLPHLPQGTEAKDAGRPRASPRHCPPVGSTSDPKEAAPQPAGVTLQAAELERRGGRGQGGQGEAGRRRPEPEAGGPWLLFPDAPSGPRAASLYRPDPRSSRNSHTPDVLAKHTSVWVSAGRGAGRRRAPLCTERHHHLESVLLSRTTTAWLVCAAAGLRKGLGGGVSGGSPCSYPERQASGAAKAPGLGARCALPAPLPGPLGLQRKPQPQLQPRWGRRQDPGRAERRVVSCPPGILAPAEWKLTRLSSKSLDRDLGAEMTLLVSQW